MSHFNDPTSPASSSQEPPKPYGSNVTGISPSDVPRQNQTTITQQDQREIHQDSSSLHYTVTEMPFPDVSPMNTDASYVYPRYFGKATMNTGGTQRGSYVTDNHNASPIFLTAEEIQCILDLPNMGLDSTNSLSNLSLLNIQTGGNHNNSFTLLKQQNLPSIDKRYKPQQFPPSDGAINSSSGGYGITPANSCLLHWTTTLTMNDMSTKLYPDTQFVEDHILKHLPEEYWKNISQTGPGVMVKVYDRDTDTTHDICLGIRGKVYQLWNTWKKDFVYRRRLHCGEQIGLWWDPSDSMLHLCSEEVKILRSTCISDLT